MKKYRTYNSDKDRNAKWTEELHARLSKNWCILHKHYGEDNNITRAILQSPHSRICIITDKQDISCLEICTIS